MPPKRSQASDSPLRQGSEAREMEEFPLLWRPPVDGGLSRGPEAVLLQKGHISPAQLREATIRQQREASHSSVLEVLVKSNAITEALATQAVAAHFKLPSMHLDAADIDPDTFALLPEEYVRANLVIPIRREDDEIVVGISYPADDSLLNRCMATPNSPKHPAECRWNAVHYFEDYSGWEK